MNSFQSSDDGKLSGFIWRGGCLLYGLRRYSGVLEGYVWGAGCPNHHPEM
jgi:hypothetical protein